MRLARFFQVTILLSLAGGVLFAKDHSIADNGKPLAFKILRVSETRETQNAQTFEYAIPMSALAQGGTYRGPLQTTVNSGQIPLDASDSFVILTFSVSNVRRKLQLSTSDVQLIDGKGASHNSLGCPSFIKVGSWTACDAIELNSKMDNVTSWIFKAPTESLAGAVIRFQGSTYPLSVTN